MKQFLAFAFILLVTLSMVNAGPLQRRETQFGKCLHIPKLPEQPEPIEVSISPDPVVPGKPDTFTITATLKKPITPDYIIVITFADVASSQGQLLADPAMLDICTGETKCPIEPGTKFSTTGQVTPPELPQ